MKTTETKREHISYGYKAYNGVVLSDIHVDGYNRIQDEINTWISDGRKVPEHLLNWSHRYFVLSCTC